KNLSIKNLKSPASFKSELPYRRYKETLFTYSELYHITNTIEAARPGFRKIEFTPQKIHFNLFP
ncbi:MAG: hypothetical protein QUS12_10980, partial [Methanosarcina sp.]|nr:hypothetical protein [Methanosarcina sp.]